MKNKSVDILKPFKSVPVTLEASGDTLKQNIGEL